MSPSPLAPPRRVLLWLGPLCVTLWLGLGPVAVHAQEEGGEEAGGEEAGGEEAGGEEAAAPEATPWAEATPAVGRKRAMFHAAAFSRMESWSMKVAEGDLPAFQKAFEQRLTAAGYKVRGSEKIVVNGYPATMRRYAGTIHEQSFDVAVLEVYRRGQLWHFSAVLKPSEELDDAGLVSALTSFASAQL